MSTSTNTHIQSSGTETPVRTIKTREEVEALKKDWEKDPAWDLAKTEGFEEFAVELQAHEDAFNAYTRAVFEAKRTRYSVAEPGYSFGECTDVETDGPVLIFTDRHGNFNKLCGAWHIVKLPAREVPKRDDFFKTGGGQ